MSNCTLCNAPVEERDAIYGIDYANCGPVHPDCAYYDDWLYFHRPQEA